MINIRELKTLTEELKPCPFCGGVWVKCYEVPGQLYVVGCEECGCQTSTRYWPDEVAKVWNLRANNE